MEERPLELIFSTDDIIGILKELKSRGKELLTCIDERAENKQTVENIAEFFKSREESKELLEQMGSSKGIEDDKRIVQEYGEKPDLTLYEAKLIRGLNISILLREGKLEQASKEIRGILTKQQSEYTGDDMHYVGLLAKVEKEMGIRYLNDAGQKPRKSYKTVDAMSRFETEQEKVNSCFFKAERLAEFALHFVPMDIKPRNDLIEINILRGQYTTAVELIRAQEKFFNIQRATGTQIMKCYEEDVKRLQELKQRLVEIKERKNKEIQERREARAKRKEER